MPVGLQTRQVLSNYLAANALPRLACITNVLPNARYSIDMVTHCNYICFCTCDEQQHARALCLAYLYGFRRVSYDCCIATLEQHVLLRQYNYIIFETINSVDAKDFITFIVNNKIRINYRYPILIRVIGSLRPKKMTSKRVLIAAKLGLRDIIYQVT
jgi:hypothetical protein